ncbi:MULTISPECIES: hypothetical protein [Candidatus Methylopumilus]|uniref:hypothetical protein n=1 Tax=Candidatus Methylopumilus TaxID=1679002 RepID=UPI001121BA92|nr:hypothetical protein [Candidatus Methylopumilus planktonicus]QDD00520.1 hypothetical protein FIT68_04605 [Candidatus Methylopumilus planktonicus]
MSVLITILSGLGFLFAFGLVFHKQWGAKVAGFVVLISSLYAYDKQTLMPFLIAFIILLIMKKMGLDPGE